MTTPDEVAIVASGRVSITNLTMVSTSTPPLDIPYLPPIPHSLYLCVLPLSIPLYITSSYPLFIPSYLLPSASTSAYVYTSESLSLYASFSESLFLPTFLLVSLYSSTSASSYMYPYLVMVLSSSLSLYLSLCLYLSPYPPMSLFLSQFF